MMETSSKQQNKILTLPNILSFFRLALIPIICWLYISRKEYLLTAVVLIISGVTDIVDGFIARHWNMISDFGKALDPIADKLTQCAMLICLVSRFTLMILPLLLLAVKEIVNGIFSLMAIKKTGEVRGAVWHGKVATAILYIVMILHLLWYEIPTVASDVMILVCVIVMAISFVLYLIGHIKTIREN